MFQFDQAPNLADPIRESRVLVVDDGAANRELLRYFLKNDGYKSVEIAADGAEALRLVESWLPDLVILDLAMPGLDGFEVCQKLHNDMPDMPVLIQSAFTGARERSRAFEVGATDFVTKPIHQYEFLARVQYHLKSRVLIRKYQQSQTRINAELDLAKSMHTDLLPSAEQLTKLMDYYKVEVESHYVSSSELGGDLWGLHSLDRSRLAVFVLDFSGHGVASAINGFRLHTMLRSLPDLLHNPADFLHYLNRRLYELLNVGQFATIFYGVIDTENHTLTYAGAASPGGMLVRKTEPHEIDMMPTQSLPLGISTNAQYFNHQVNFNKDETLFIYSDALIETGNQSGVFWNEQNIADFIIAHKENNGDEPFLEPLLKEFYRERLNHLVDDLTAVTLRLWQ